MLPLTFKKMHRRPPSKFTVGVIAKNGSAYKDAASRFATFADALAHARKKVEATGREHMIFFGSVLIYKCCPRSGEKPCPLDDVPSQYLAALHDSDYHNVMNSISLGDTQT